VIQQLIAFGVSFTTIRMKIVQQQNVIHRRLVGAVVCSFCMAALDVGLVGLVVKNSWAICLPVGAGGALGCVLAIRFYPRKSK